MHLFDIDVPGKIRFQESEVLSPGNELMTFDTGMWLLCHVQPIPMQALSSGLLKYQFKPSGQVCVALLQKIGLC